MSRSTWMKVWFAGFCAVVLASAGCTSVRTTHFVQGEDKCSWETKHMRGVPVTFKVPTHFEIRIIERQYMDSKGNLIADSTTKVPFATRHVRLHVREKDELMTVDFVKPAAGTSDIVMKFDNQYFKEVSGTIEDKTIESITNSIKTLTDVIPVRTAAKQGFKQADEGDNKLTLLDSVVASVLIDIHDCDIEAKIQAFLDQHLNHCRPACSPSPYQFGQPKFAPPAPAPLPMKTGGAMLSAPTTVVAPPSPSGAR